MDIRKHICFAFEEAPDLAIYLKKNGLVNDINGTVVLDIFEDTVHWPVISDCVKSNNLFCLSETLFSEQELQQAEWLTVRSQWRFEYPQPEKTFSTLRLPTHQGNIVMSAEPAWNKWMISV